MSPSIYSLTHGASGLLLGYTAVLAPLVAGLLQGRAATRQLLLSPVLAVPLGLVAAISATTADLLLFHSGPESLLQAGFGLVVCGAVGYAAGRMVASNRQPPDTLHRRGAVVSNAGLPGRHDTPAARGADRGSEMTLAGMPLTPQDETKHFKLIGTTGTGKSTAIRELLSAALARGDRAVIADPDGSYLDRFYDAERGDVILNPFACDAAKWNLFAEITNDYDVDQLARSLIPDGGEQDRIWSEYARTFFVAVTKQAMAAQIQNDAQLYHLVNAEPVSGLRRLLAGTPAGPFLEEGNEKMFGSIRSVASSAVRALEYTTRQPGRPFSVREWVRLGESRLREGTQPGDERTHPGAQYDVRSGVPGGVLFFPYKAGEIAALRSTISAWMRLAIFEAMNREEGDQRLWFIVDELDALGEIDGLKDALARLRKFGGRCVLGFQSIAQVSSTYGRGTADTIVENCGNTLILRCSASERGGTSEFASKLIGQREVLQTTRSKTRKPSDWWASITTSQHVKIEPAILASEIERLPDLQGFLKLASVPDWKQVTVTAVNYPKVGRHPSPPNPRTPRARATRAPDAQGRSRPKGPGPVHGADPGRECRE